MNRIRWYGPTFVLLIALVAVMVSGPMVARQIAWAQHDTQISLIRNDLHENLGLAQLSEAFRKVAEVVEPSVVSIEVLQRSNGRNQRRQVLPPGFEDFFEQFPGQQQPRDDDGGDFDRYAPAIPRGQGSGWVYDEQGHIVTNNHVVADGDEIRVRFHDGREYEAEVVGTDPSTDVAVLKIDANGLHPLPVAENDIHQGEIVFAFGSPFRFEFSMSQGIVSAKARQLGIIQGRDAQGRPTAGYENFIQTDAAINPGNSGGPLTNIYGEAVGMNTAIASRTSNPMQAGFVGLGFAIPVRMVTEIADQLIATGEVQRGYLGVYIDDIDERMAETFGYDSDDGVLVVEPIAGGPGEAAGLQAGDIITHVDDAPVSSADQLRNTIARIQPGETISLTVFRNGESLAVDVELARLPTQASARQPSDAPEDAGPESVAVETLRKLGITDVQTFTPQLAEQAGMTHMPGVVIADMRRNSIAAASGLMPGMLITQVMGNNVSDADQLLETIEQFEPGERVRLRIAQWNSRDGRWQPRFVVLELPSD